MTVQALLVGHNPDNLATITNQLQQDAPDVVLTAAQTINDAKQALSSQHYNILIIDHIPSDDTVLDVLDYSRKNNYQTAYIVQAERYETLQPLLHYPYVYPLITTPGYLQILPLLIKQASKSLSASYSLLDTLQEGILILDQQSNIVHLNKCMQTLIGNSNVVGQARAEAVNRAKQALVRRYVNPIYGQDHAVVGYLEAYISADAVVKPEPPGSSAEEMAQMRDRLMSRISHEVKTPLTSVLGFAHMMLTRPDAPLEKREKWANFIHTKSDLLNRIMDNILNFSAMESGYSELKLETVDAADAVRNVATEFEAMETGRSVELDVPESLPNITVDIGYFQQSLINLLLNAHHMTPEGTSITMRAQSVDQTIQFSFVDRGKNLNIEDFDRVFAPFSAEPGAGYQPGKGLWLPLAKSIIEAHGGRIWIEPTPGGGNTFVVSIPSR